MGGMDENRHQIQVGSLPHLILKILKDSLPKEKEAIWGELLPKKIKLITLEELETIYLTRLVTDNLLLCAGSFYSLAIDGYAMLNFLNMKANKKEFDKALVKPANLDRSGKYTGEELKASCMRPGAYAFLAYPSRMGDLLSPHPSAAMSEFNP